MDDRTLVEYLGHIDSNVTEVRRKLNVLLNEEYYMADALQAAYDALSAEVADVETAEGTAVAALQDAVAKLTSIQPGTTVTADQLESLASGLKAATSTLSTASTDESTAAPAPVDLTPPADVAPADPTTPPADAAPADPTTPPADAAPATVDPATLPADTTAPADTPAQADPTDVGEAAAVAVAAAGGTPVDPSTAEIIAPDDASVPTPSDVDAAASQPATPGPPDAVTPA